jgi:hypothetical protein
MNFRVSSTQYIAALYECFAQPRLHAKIAEEQTCLTAVRDVRGSALRSEYGLNEYTLRSLRKNSSVLLCVRKIAPEHITRNEFKQLLKQVRMRNRIIL